MNILTEEEIDYWVGSNTQKKSLARAIESAVLAKLAKLAVMEMPPVPNLTQEEREFLHYNQNTGDLVDFVQGHAAEYGRQAYAQGAASQLASEPVGEVKSAELPSATAGESVFSMSIHMKHLPPVGTPLYILKEPK